MSLPDPQHPSPPPHTLAALSGLRTAPSLDDSQRALLLAELRQAVSPYPWFTLGVMATSAEAAVQALRRWETAFGWSHLEAADPGWTGLEGPVFLKGNQRNGTFQVRVEAGLGEGLLLTGQDPDSTDRGETWGPLPLDLVGS